MIPGQLSLGSHGPRERFNFFHKAFDSLDLEHVSQKPRKLFDPEIHLQKYVLSLYEVSF